jgi:diacylglycerol kinase (ATP)
MGPHHPLRASFGFAWDGLVDAAVRDRNLRIHLGLGALAGAFVALAPLSGGERAVLILCAAAVIAAEAANSALEAAVDLVSPGRSERARIAKDSAAAAVLALAAGSVLALAAVAGPRLAELAARARALGAWPVLGAGAAAVAAGLLPAPGRRPLAADLALAATGAAGLIALGAWAEAQAGTALVALCLSVATGGAARRRRENRHSS